MSARVIQSSLVALFLIVACRWSAIGAFADESPPKAERPNVVLILADDKY